MSHLLDQKTAVIYGAAGSIGSAVAEAFAREGARVVCTGRTREPLEALAARIGGEAAVVDALDAEAVDAHADALGHIDISFNLVTRGDHQGTPLVDMTVEDLLEAPVNGLKAAFFTSRAALRNGATVVLHLTSGSARGSAPMMGSTGPADAASEAYMRYLAAENGARGVRVVGIHTAGVNRTLSLEKLAAVDPEAGKRMEQIDAFLRGRSMLGMRPELDQIAATATFLASDGAGAITSGIINATCGLVAG